MEQETKKGTVKFFNSTRGFGFIKDEETQEEIFVHATGLKHKINQDDRVSFKTKDSNKGLVAVNVELIN